MSPFVTALVVTAAFAVFGWAVRGVDASGAVAGFAVAFALYYCIGPAAFAVLLAVFVLTWIATRLGYRRKSQLGIAERRGGRRTAGQVLANIGVAGVFAVAARVANNHLLWLASTAALCSAAADTVSSECGEAWSDRAYLITNFCAVPPGTDGAVSAPGTFAGIAGSAATAIVAWRLLNLSVAQTVLIGAAGAFGMFVDSLLGATVEARGLLSNNGVNFVSTLSAALLAAFFSFV